MHNTFSNNIVFSSLTSVLTGKGYVGLGKVCVVENCYIFGRHVASRMTHGGRFV